MATKLAKPVTRVVSVKDYNGNEVEVAVTMSAGGLTFHKGRRKLYTIPWLSIAKLSTFPPGFPARFTGNPLGWFAELNK